MTGGILHRALRRLTLVTTLVVAVSVAHGALAAPAGQVDAVVAEIQEQVSQVRGLPARAQTPVETMPRAALVERLSRAFNTDAAIREFLTSQMLLEVLGAMERRYDLRDLQLRLLSEQTLAVYDFDAKAISLVADYAAGGDLGADARLTVAHELTHALQDQHFDLKRVLPADAENSDAAIAARALVEGDAMLTMRIWGRQFLRPSDKRALGDDATPNDPVLDAAPPLVRGELLFPYDAGWVFAQLLYQDGGFAAIDRAFARPPRSTEQVLHPEKYVAGENPIDVEMPALSRGLGGTWTTRRTDVFGELVLRLLLEPNVGWPTAEAAAAGWGGDAYTILEDDAGRRVVAMVTVWDTEGDAAEMYNAFVQSIAAQYQGQQQRTIVLPSVARWTIPEYQIQALKTDNVVRIIYAPDALTLDRVEVQLGGTSIGPAGPVAPRPSTLPDVTPIATPSSTTGPTPDADATPDAEPGRFAPTLVPTPTAPPSTVTPASDGPGDDLDEPEPVDGPGAPAPPLPPAPTPTAVPNLPPAQPMMPSSSGATTPDDDSESDEQAAPTPQTIQPPPRVTPQPITPSGQPTEIED